MSTTRDPGQNALRPCSGGNATAFHLLRMVFTVAPILFGPRQVR